MNYDIISLLGELWKNAEFMKLVEKNYNMQRLGIKQNDLWKSEEFKKLIEKFGINKVRQQALMYNNNYGNPIDFKNRNVYDKYGKPQKLGEHISSGGEGEIIALEKHDHIVVKIYKEEKLKKLGKQLHEKIKAQVSMKTHFENTNIAWPQLEIFDQFGNFIGYAMRRAQGIPLSKLAHPKLQEEYFPDHTRQDIVIIILNIIQNVKVLHANNIFLGDINLSNFLVDDDSITYPPSHNVYLIDTDSYQIIHNGKYYPCPVGRPEMTPIEHHNQPYEKIVRTRESDLFSLAILFFQVLMRGRHPYDQIGGADPVENLRSGNFPYGKGSKPPGTQGAIPPGPWYTIWSHLSYKIKELFIICFRAGVLNPQQRPSLEEWETVFQSYLNGLEQGHFNNFIQPDKPKQSSHKWFSL